MTKHRLTKLDNRGHGPVTEWSPQNAVEVKTAEEAFKELQEGDPRQGIVPHKLYDVSKPQETGGELKIFDPEAEEIIAVPQLVGG